MVYLRKYRGSHDHNEEMCLCGKIKGSKKKESKFHNKTQNYNGHHYDSMFEAEYAQALDFSLKNGSIKSWERQVKLDLRINDMHLANYYIDFIVTHNDGVREFVEVKGMEQDLWKLKWKILEATFDQFKEGPDDFMTVIKQVNWGPPKPRMAKK